MFGEFWTQIFTYVTAPSFYEKKYVFDWSSNRLINLREKQEDKILQTKSSNESYLN